MCIEWTLHTRNNALSKCYFVHLLVPVNGIIRNSVHKTQKPYSSHVDSLLLLIVCVCADKCARQRIFGSIRSLVDGPANLRYI